MRASSTPPLDMGRRLFQDRFRGERIPDRDVAYFDGSDPDANAQLLPVSVQPDGLRTAREAAGQGEAVVFARSATAGTSSSSRSTGRGIAHRPSSRWPKVSVAGLSLGLSGFGFWSHDIGGFEGTPPGRSSL